MDQHNFTFDSIGTRFWLERLDGEPFSARLKAQILAYSEQFDDTYSRFKDSSLLGQLATTGELLNPPQELIDMLTFSKRMYALSNGAFNITVGAALHKLGYGKREHGGDVLAEPWSDITWNANRITVPKGLMLDFGGFGKGWLIDALCAILRKNGIHEFIVNGGGDLFVQNDQPVEFALEDPLHPGAVLKTVAIQTGALAGSDIFKRSWDDSGTRRHHIINPVNGEPTSGNTVASYVVAQTALIADTLSTIVLVNSALRITLQAQCNAEILLITS